MPSTTSRVSKLATPKVQSGYKCKWVYNGSGLEAMTKPICYHSETILHGGVLNYPAYKNELYALVQTIKKVEALSYGKEDRHLH